VGESWTRQTNNGRGEGLQVTKHGVRVFSTANKPRRENALLSFFYCLAGMVPLYRCVICGGWDSFSLTPSISHRHFFSYPFHTFSLAFCLAVLGRATGFLSTIVQ